MSAIGPGDWLECINDNVIPELAPLVLGALYCVEALEEAEAGTECVGCGSGDYVDLVGMPKHPAAVYCLCAFRPIGPGESEQLSSTIKTTEPA